MSILKKIFTKKVKNNENAASAPTLNDDSSSGYSFGSMWKYGSAVYMLTNAAVGAAVWRDLTNTGAISLKGSWDASTNTPTLADGVGTIGDFLLVSVAGSQDLGSGVTQDFGIGDWVVYYDNDDWEKHDAGVGYDPVNKAGDTMTGNLIVPNLGLSGEILDSNSNELLGSESVASAVNEITIKNAATGNAPETQATGDDANIDYKIVTKGSGVVKHNSNTAANLGTAQEYTATQNFDATSLVDGATIAWDASANQVAKVTLGDNRTMAAPTNLKDGATYILRIIQDGTGSRTITWNAVFKWSGGTAPTLTTTANAVDIISFVSDGTNLYGSFIGNFS